MLSPNYRVCYGATPKPSSGLRIRRQIDLIVGTHALTRNFYLAFLPRAILRDSRCVANLTAILSAASDCGYLGRESSKADSAGQHRGGYGSVTRCRQPGWFGSLGGNAGGIGDCELPRPAGSAARYGCRVHPPQSRSSRKRTRGEENLPAPHPMNKGALGPIPSPEFTLPSNA